MSEPDHLGRTIPDIVRTLRECAPLVGQADIAEEVVLEAADEIERLRAALRTVFNAYEETCPASWPRINRIAKEALGE
jgi:hypothetical protein